MKRKQQYTVKTQAVVAFRPIGARAKRKWSALLGTIGNNVASSICERTFPSAKEAQAFVERNRKGWDFHSVRVAHTLIGRVK